MKTFIINYIILQWGQLLEVLVNSSFKVKGFLKKYLKELYIKRITISPYNLKANGLNEESYYQITLILTKFTNKNVIRFKK